MKIKLIISIIDNNIYYVEGLIMILTDFFKKHDTPVQFIHGPPNGCAVDIIFHILRGGTATDSWRRLPSGSHQPLYFTIRSKTHPRQEDISHNSGGQKTLYYHQSIAFTLDIIWQAIILHRSLSPKTMSYRYPSVLQLLTLREREVLNHIKQGKTQVETANCMSLKVKTVSSHKRSAMRKLNFRRNNELFHWMLQGGLSN